MLTLRISYVRVALGGKESRGAGHHVGIMYAMLIISYVHNWWITRRVIFWVSEDLMNVACVWKKKPRTHLFVLLVSRMNESLTSTTLSFSSLNIHPTEDVPPLVCVTAGCKLCVVGLSNMNVNPRDAGLLRDKSEASFINRLWCISSVYARVHVLHQTFLFFSWSLDLKALFCMCKHNSSSRQRQY